MPTRLTLLIAGFSLATWAGGASAQQPCELFTEGEVHQRVNGILSAPTREDGLQQTLELGEMWDNCRRPELLRPEVLNDLARLLDRLELLPYVIPIFYGIGAAARPVQPRMHQAYLAHRRSLRDAMRELRRNDVGFMTGPAHGSVQALRCLDLWLQTGRRVRKYCIYLDG